MDIGNIHLLWSNITTLGVIQGAEVVLTPPLLHSYVVEGVTILLSHPVYNIFWSQLQPFYSNFAIGLENVRHRIRFLMNCSGWHLPIKYLLTLMNLSAKI